MKYTKLFLNKCISPGLVCIYFKTLQVLATNKTRYSELIDTSLTHRYYAETYMSFYFSNSTLYWC